MNSYYLCTFYTNNQHFIIENLLYKLDNFCILVFLWATRTPQNNEVRLICYLHSFWPVACAGFWFGKGNENGDPALRVSATGAQGRGVRGAKPPGRWRIFLKNKKIY